MNSVVVAKYLLALCKKHGISMNQTKLQKMMYIVYGAYLAINNERICDEHPKAWPYGPVFPRVQKHFAKTDRFTSVEPSLIEDGECSSLKQNVELNNIILDVIKTFGEYSAKQLSDWSHQEDSPWKKALDSNNGQWNAEISDEVLEDYFKKEVIA